MPIHIFQQTSADMADWASRQTAALIRRDKVHHWTKQQLHDGYETYQSVTHSESNGRSESMSVGQSEQSTNGTSKGEQTSQGKNKYEQSSSSERGKTSGGGSGSSVGESSSFGSSAGTSTGSSLSNQTGSTWGSSKSWTLKERQKYRIESVPQYESVGEQRVYISQRIMQLKPGERLVVAFGQVVSLWKPEVEWSCPWIDLNQEYLENYLSFLKKQNSALMTFDDGSTSTTEWNIDAEEQASASSFFTTRQHQLNWFRRDME